MTPISICIIAKNEEKHIDSFLSSIKTSMATYPHEIIFIDTGSSDSTKTLASKYIDKIFDFPWINDFSAARNFSLEKAFHDWVLILDCDEYITDLDPVGFQQMIKQNPQGIGMITRKNHYQMNGHESIYTDQVERFFHKQYFHYEGIIHEQVVSLTNKKPQKVLLPLTVAHSGYQLSQEELVQKATRNNNLLLKMLEESPNDPYLYFQLGQSYNAIKDTEKACYYYAKGLEFDVNPQLGYVQLMVIGYGYSLLNLKRYQEALSFESIYDAFCSSADFVFLMGLIYMNNALFDEAIMQFLKATTLQEHSVEGINSYLSYYNIGVIYECVGLPQEATKYYKMCGEYEVALAGLKRTSK